jgi:hypothetical protein
LDVLVLISLLYHRVGYFFLVALLHLFYLALIKLSHVQTSLVLLCQEFLILHLFIVGVLEY